MNVILWYFVIGITLFSPLYCIIHRSHQHRSSGLGLCVLGAIIWPLGFPLSFITPNDWINAWKAYKDRLAWEETNRNISINETNIQIEKDIEEVLKLIEYDYHGLYGKHLGEQPPIEVPSNAAETELKQGWVTICYSCESVAHPPLVQQNCLCERCRSQHALQMRADKESHFLNGGRGHRLC